MASSGLEFPQLVESVLPGGVGAGGVRLGGGRDIDRSTRSCSDCHGHGGGSCSIGGFAERGWGDGIVDNLLSLGGTLGHDLF